MPKTNAMGMDELTKKLKSARKRIKLLEKRLDSAQEASDRFEKRQDNLMFNLRRALKELKMKPEFPKK